tara:strand:+ start:216 stop:548 length:333 start_codon:yes stop_codon:yes gene_type:complete
MPFLMRKLMATLLSGGLNYVVGYILKTQWLHFKILSFLEKKAKSSENRIDDWGLMLARYLLEKWHGLRPMTDTDKLIATVVLSAMAKNPAIKGFTFRDLKETRRKLGLIS